MVQKLYSPFQTNCEFQVYPLFRPVISTDIEC